MADMLRLIKQHRFTVMLAFMLVYMISLPVLELSGVATSILGSVLNAIFFSLLLISLIYSVNETRRSMVAAAMLVGLGILSRAVYLLWHSEPFFVIYHGFYILFLGFVVYCMMRFLFESQRVNANMISASLCNYLLIGLFWAVVYSLTAELMPVSFYISGSADHAMAFGSSDAVFPVYYSFITLTTLGYGDVYPVTPLTQMLAAVEALTGQLYLVVIVARLVGLHIAGSTASRER